jgi:hypothetical protein
MPTLGAGLNAGDPVEPLKEALFVAVGFAVLAAQRANVARLEFEQRHASEISALETKVEQVMERVEGTLPEPARSWLHGTRSAGAAAQDRLRHLLGSA